MKKFQIKLSGGIAIEGKVHRAGETVSVDEKFARQLLHRGKGVLVNGSPDESTDSDLSDLTVADLRKMAPDAPARATKAELIALIEGKES